MNPLPVSLDLTSNSTSKPTTKASASNDAGADKFKNELNKQEKNTKNNDVANNSANDKNTQNNEVSAKKEVATVAADSASNGEQLPQKDESESLSSETTLEQSVDSAYLGELEIPSGQTSIANPQGLLDSLDTPVSVTGILGFDMVSGEDGALGSLYLTGEESGGYLVSAQTGPYAGPLNAGAVDGAAVVSEGGLLNQPLEKLMTLEQIKLSLEKSVEALAELEVDVEADSEGNIREVFRFNDIQLKESQSSLKTYTTSVELPVAPGAWAEKVNDKIIWLANQKIQFAEIHLNPQDLGPMEVKINVQNDQATVTFTSHNQGVRELLEQNVNRLREMMSENGVDLAHVDVSDQSSQQQSGDEQEDGVGGQSANGENELSGQDSSHLVTEDITLDNLVDYYA